MIVSELRRPNVCSTDVEFWTSIVSELLSTSHNFFHDNIDRVRFPGRIPFARRMKDSFLELAASKQWSRRPTYGPSNVTEVLAVDGLAQTYDLLEDRDSRDLFVKLLLYRMLGARKVKLPTNSPDYWEKIEEAKQYLRKENVIHGVPIVGSLDLYAFEAIELVCHLMNVVNTFLLEQYRCDRAGVRAEPGDVTIDAGGCWGDTALYFARQAERVYCYECIPSNIEIIKRNLALNPGLAKKIIHVPKALSREAGATLNFADTGPGSHIVDTGFQVQTDSIDNLVENNHLGRVDFIKMDIEGAEMDALMGAERTIRAHRPRLAISIYHSLQDFVRIPRWIASLDVGYRIFLDHFTIHEEETVLFARSDSQVGHGL